MLFIKKCPKCGKKEYVFKIVYGYIPNMDIDKMDAKRKLWGGDTKKKQKWMCIRCNIHY